MSDIKSTEADRETIRRVNGLYVGMLSNSEIGSFERCIADGYAKRSYSSAGGLLLGLSVVEFLDHPY